MEKIFGPGPGDAAVMTRSYRRVVSVDAGAVLQQDTASRRESAGEDSHPRRIVEQQPRAGVRQRYDAAEHTEALAEDLGVTESLRGAVVEEHDPVGQRHRAGGPRDHRRA